MKLYSNLSTSMVNQNSYNSSHKGTNGLASLIEFAVDSLELMTGLFDLSISDWTRGSDYYSLGHENDVQQRRFWNLDSSFNRDIKESKINSRFSIPEYGISNIEIAQLNHRNSSRSRFILSHDITHLKFCLLYTSPSPRDRQKSRMPYSD